MTARTLLGTAVLGVLFAMPAFAADRGVNEVAGSLSYTDVEDTTTTMIDLSYGRYLTNMHEVGLTVSYMELEVDDVDSVDGTTLGVFYNLNFDNGGTMVPYLGVDLATIGGDLGDAYDLSYGVSAGLKLYPYENAGINVAISYQKLQGAEDFIDDADGTAINVGLMLRF
jgi:hypothetical protein